MNLAFFYPVIYWNTANLITDSASFAQTNDEGDEEDELEECEIENYESDDYDGYDYIEIKDASGKIRKVKKTVDYGKISTAINRFKTYNIKVLPPDINSSGYTFTPDEKNNIINYGLRGITRMPDDLIKTIIDNRPYLSLADFNQKIKTNKLQLLYLIKSGAFDRIEGKPREEIMESFINSITDKKEKLTLQNMQMLIDKQVIPDSMAFYIKLYSFNKFLKGNKEGLYYNLSEPAINFIDKNFSLDLTENGNKILQKVWDNTYKKAMEPMRSFLKANQKDMLDKLNIALYNEMKNKYATGNISSWEMDSLSFYYHDHELTKFQKEFDDFYKLSEDPDIEYSFTAKDGQVINIFKTHTIIGTVIDKEKTKNLITLLTPTGVVPVKVYKNQFAQYDKQISQVGADGKKHVLERSWFRRGTLLRIQGIRRGQNFIARKNKNSLYPLIMKITSAENDVLEYQWDRLEVD